MSRATRLVLITAAGVVAAVVAHVLDPHGTADDLALLSAGIVVGEILVLRLEDRSAVPLSFAVMVVLAASFGAKEYALAILAAQLVAFVGRVQPVSAGWRAVLVVDRVVVAAATYAAYRAVRDVFDHDETVAAVLLALGAAAAAQLVADQAVRTALRMSHILSLRARLAWLAVASSGMLMAVGYRGVDGDGDVGIWGPLLFATPLLAAWYAFERLDAAIRSYRQTIEALAMAPEFGGLVVPGHAQRVAALAVAIGRELGLSSRELDDLERAALLHHLGQVTLEDPQVAGRPEPGDVAVVTSAMLREIRPLAAAGDIVVGDLDDPRRRLAAQALRIASTYDDMTAGDGTPPAVALETLRSTPGYVHERRLLDALERAVRTDRGSASPTPDAALAAATAHLFGE